MDDLVSNRNGGGDLDEPIKFEIDDDAGSQGVSHSPLHLGRYSDEQAAGPETSPKAAEPAGPARSKPVQAGSEERITGVRTFFTKLHAGSLDFLDEQISNWLRENPQIRIKRTNTVTGELAAKKTEPNIIVTIWY